MISVIVPLKDEPEKVLAPLRRLVGPPESEIIVADGRLETRGASLAHAALRARGEIFFFLHADSRPPERALALIRETIDAGAASGAFSLAYADSDLRMRWIAWWANRRAIVFGLAFGDQGIFCRRDAYEAAGGFRDLPVCDDLDLVRRLRRVGRFVVRPEKTVTSARRYRERGALRQMLRVWKVVGGYFLGASPDRLSRWYYG